MSPRHFVLTEKTSRRISSALLALAILTIGLAAVTTNCADPDLWGHVQYGREVLRDKTLPQTATWTYAAEGAPWVNHENIAELLLASTVDTFGPLGLPWLKLGLAVLIFGLMIVCARRSGVGWLAIGVVVTLVAANMQFHWHFRPQILTYVCLAIMLTVWQYVFRDSGHRDIGHRDTASIRNLAQRSKWLWLLPPLMCFWANSHGGFAAGLAILCVFHGLTCLLIIRASGWRSGWALLHLSMVTVISIAATLLNPYGPGLWQFMIQALRLPRPEIEDWGPLGLWTSEAVRFWCLITVVAVSIAYDRSRLQLAQLAILGLLLWQGVSHCRHISIFAIVCGFWIPPHLHHLCETAMQTLQRTKPQRQLGEHRPGMTGLLLPAGVVILSLLKLAPQLNDVPVDRSEYPVAAMQFMHDRELQGKVVVTFNWAQYAIGCFAATDQDAASRVAVDGRFETCYPREITDIYFDFWLGTADPSLRYRSPLSGSFDPAQALEYQDPDLILLSREQRPSVRTIEQHLDKWILLYQDSLAQVWGRRSKYGVEQSPLYVPVADRWISEIRQEGSVTWPAFPVDAAARNRDQRITFVSSPIRERKSPLTAAAADL